MSRTRGINVTPINAAALATATVPEQVAELLTDFGVLALATGTNGTEYLVCQEGVGWVARDAFASWLPPVAADFGTVDLADFIRTFGARLDCNHADWVWRLTA